MGATAKPEAKILERGQEPKEESEVVELDAEVGKRFQPEL
jgi:hypothetical protein